MSHDFPPAAPRYNSDLPEVERFDPQAEEELIAQRTAQWREALQPTNPFLVWMVGQIAELSVRIEDCARRRRARRDALARRAADCWDDDRRAAAERLGASLADAPARVSRVLQETPQGCQWMIERWEALAKVLEARGSWNDAQRRLALDLLGTPDELRGEPHPFDLPGGDVAPALALVRDAINALTHHRDYWVRGLDLVSREAEALGLNLAADKVLVQIQREEAAYRRQQQTALARFPNLRPTRGARQAAAVLVRQPPRLQSSPRAPVPPPPIPVAAETLAAIPDEPPVHLTVSTVPEPPTQPSPTRGEGSLAPSPLVGEGWGGGRITPEARTIRGGVSPGGRDIPSALTHSITKTEQPPALSRTPLAPGRPGTPRAPRNRHERRALQRMACRA